MNEDHTLNLIEGAHGQPQVDVQKHPGRQSIPHIDIRKYIHGDTVFMIIYVIIFLGNNLPLKSSPSVAYAHSQMIHNEFVAS